MRAGITKASRVRRLARAALTLCAGLVLLAGTATAAQSVDPALRAALKQAIEGSDSFDTRFDAEVWLLDMSARLKARIPDTDRRLEFLRLLHREAKRAGLKPEWVLAVIEVESDFNRFAISYAGARGLMQVMPFWLEEIGHPEDNLFNVQTNLRMGCTILRYYLDREDGDLTRALARYNGSLGSNRYPLKVFQALNDTWYPQ